MKAVGEEPIIRRCGSTATPCGDSSAPQRGKAQAGARFERELRALCRWRRCRKRRARARGGRIRTATGDSRGARRRPAAPSGNMRRIVDANDGRWKTSSRSGESLGTLRRPSAQPLRPLHCDTLRKQRFTASNNLHVFSQWPVIEFISGVTSRGSINRGRNGRKPAELIQVLRKIGCAAGPTSRSGNHAAAPVAGLNHSRRWSVYYLWREGVRSRGLARCPADLAALEAGRNAMASIAVRNLLDSRCQDADVRRNGRHQYASHRAHAVDRPPAAASGGRRTTRVAAGKALFRRYDRARGERRDDPPA